MVSMQLVVKIISFHLWSAAKRVFRCIDVKQLNTLFLKWKCKTFHAWVVNQGITWQDFVRGYIWQCVCCISKFLQFGSKWEAFCITTTETFSIGVDIITSQVSNSWISAKLNNCKIMRWRERELHGFILSRCYLLPLLNSPLIAVWLSPLSQGRWKSIFIEHWKVNHYTRSLWLASK